MYFSQPHVPIPPWTLWTRSVTALVTAVNTLSTVRSRAYTGSLLAVKSWNDFLKVSCQNSPLDPYDPGVKQPFIFQLLHTTLNYLNGGVLDRVKASPKHIIFLKTLVCADGSPHIHERNMINICYKKSLRNFVEDIFLFMWLFGVFFCLNTLFLSWKKSP